MTQPIPSFSYHLPTAIEFGHGALARLPALARGLGGQRALIVGDPGVERAGLVGRIADVLSQTEMPIAIFTDVESDPDIRSVEQGTAIAKAERCDFVIGIGGGSALDTAKAIGLMLTNAGTIRDYVGINKVPQPGAPVVAIPTTAGTGSEMTIWSVLSDKAQQVKISVGSTYNCPRVALLDPGLTLSLPPHTTAATGMDALTHALESYVNRATQPISEAMSVQAMTLIARSLRVAVAQGDNLQARADMLLASTIAAMAFNSTRLGLVHAFAMPLGAKFHIPHGLVNAILLPAVMRYNLPGNLPKYAHIAEIFGERVENRSLRAAAERSVEAIEQLKQDIGITAKLSAFGLSEDRFDEVVDEALQSGNVPVNPRQPTREAMKAILRAELE
ncbi:iron-containing alcohol dehydrogenase [Salinarimonas rosea]|uniref:iron-containing alcohol dehydrogenase n=1 Tax=Salinarimonas rosea TaxID=552063 RepID=UPI00049018D5|nr:iron-containing alcohol dehydrogenase [Salinarimonas rosea]